MIKKLFRSIIVALLAVESRAILRKYKPKIIAITGNLGKTSTKDAIYQALAPHLNLRRSEKSFNSEIGVPLSILGRPNVWGSAKGWVSNLLHGLGLILFREPYPEWLVLEVGADRVGDIKQLAKWLKPDIAVFTGVPAVPVHIEFFPTRDSLVKEKRFLLASVRSGGTIIVNHDDADTAELITWLKQHQGECTIISYGFNEGASFRASNDNYIYDTVGEGMDVPKGITFKFDHAGNSMPLSVAGIFGRQQIYPILAALAVGTVLKLNLVTLSQGLTEYEAPSGRGRLLKGEKGSLILDDSYNSSPLALEAALEALGAIKAGRRIAVLGDMMELGSQTIEAHRAVGKQVTKSVDFLITVGLRAKFIAEAAKEQPARPPTESGAGGGMSPDKIMSFDEVSAAATALEPLITAGDLILVKGSQSTRLEKLVLEIMADPTLAPNLLCRQEKEWEER